MDIKNYVMNWEADMVVRYTAVATMTLLVYDYLLSLSDEVQRIWDTPFSLSKIIFLVNRHLPLVTTAQGLYMDIFASSACKRVMIAEGVLFCSGFVIAEGILLMRVYAVWGRRRLILVLLLLAYLPAVAIAYYSTALFVTSVSTVTLSTQQFGCLYKFDNRMAWAALAALLFFETFMLVLLISRYYRLGNVKSVLIQTLYKDGVLFYVCVLTLSAVNLILLESASSSSCYFFLIAQGALHSILSNHLILRLRGACNTTNPQLPPNVWNHSADYSSNSISCFSSTPSEETVLPS